MICNESENEFIHSCKRNVLTGVAHACNIISWKMSLTIVLLKYLFPFDEPLLQIPDNFVSYANAPLEIKSFLHKKLTF
jgi:hypothetical protein